MLKTNTFDIALRAEHGSERPFEKRIFGQFQAAGLMGAPVDLAFEAGRYPYVGSPLALQIWVNDGQTPALWEPYVTLTKNVRPNDCTDVEIIVKTYDANAHLRESLLGLGYFEDTGKRIEAGFTQLEIWSLTDKFVEAFDAAHPEHEFA